MTGRQVRLVVKRCKEKDVGWGVFAGQDIPAGTSVGVYVGTWETNEDMERLEKTYKEAGKRMFGMDGSDKATGSSLDACYVRSVMGLYVHRAGTPLQALSPPTN